MDQTNDSIFPEASHLNGASEDGTTESTGVSEADPPAVERTPEGVAAGIRPGFLAELAVAMRTTAEKEREHISARVAEDAALHVEKVRSRAAIETDELKRLAEEDVQHIQEWSSAEMDRIRGEADQKIDDRRASLDEYLKQHDSIIDTEIDGVNDAVRGYNTTLDRYFEELSQSNDPAVIVARAEALPAPPDLDEVRAHARARAVAMFADLDEAAAKAAPVVEAAVAAAPVAEAISDVGAPSAVQSPDMTVAGAMEDLPTASADATGEAGATAEAPTIEGTATESTPDAMAEPPATEESMVGAGAIVADASSDVEPIPVMDPVATADSSWPAPAPEPEPEPVAASVDHTSAAVRLLRSVAPWTAPTHAGSNDRTDNE
jgi:hypothetical protein